MTSSLMEHKGSLLGCFLMLLYFMWMDVALYYHVQGHKPLQPSTFTTVPTYQPGSGLQRLFAPFNEFTIKMMMIDPVNQYIHIPAATIFNEVTHFSSVFHVITPNMISVSHVFVALLGARFIASDSLMIRQAGVLLFEFRAFLDSLAGVVARVRRKQELIISDFGSIGYIVDRITYTLSAAALVIGCFWYLRKSQLPRRAPSKLNLASVESAIIGSSVSSQKRIMSVICCFSLQLFISAYFWDRYISGYHRLLENIQVSKEQLYWQNEQLKSPLMWIIIWFWRMANAHALMEMVLFSIFINRLWEFLVFIQFVGIICLISLISITEVHFQDVSNHIGKLTLPSSVLPASML